MPRLIWARLMAGGRGLLEQLDARGRRCAACRQALRVDQCQPMGAFAGAGVGGVLERLQAFAVVAAIEQHGAEPGLGVGIVGGEGAKAASAVARSPAR